MLKKMKRLMLPSYGRNLTERRSKFAIEVSGGTALMDGDYGNAE
jgi:curli production assembly/transport component CsgG